MSVTRKTVSLPEDVNTILQNLAKDCGMDASQCITQLIRRHSGDIRNLFAIDVSNRTHSYAPLLTNAIDVNDRTIPELTSTHKEPIAVEPPKASPEPTNAPMAESPAEELARLRALPPIVRAKHSVRLLELKALLEPAET